MRILIGLLLSLCTFFVSADENNPNEVIHSVSINTFARIDAEKSKLEAQPDYIKVIIEEELIPYFDYKYAAYTVLSSHLKKTTKQQRDDFVEAFKSYLVNAYGHILFEYEQQKIEIIDNKHYKDKNIISIPVRILDENGQVTRLTFKLRKNKKTQEWKVFDVIAEGISMLNTKQSELNDLLHKKGVDHVTELLKQKNSDF